MQSEATLRFNPERSTLRSSLEDAARQLSADIAAARSSSQATKATAERAAPKLRDVYGQAQGTAAQTQQDMATNFGAIPGGSVVSGAASRDTAGTQRRLAEAMAGALAETTARATEAEAGRMFAETAARGRFGENVGKIESRLGDLSQEEGAFVSGRLAELGEESAARKFTARENARNRAQSERSSKRSAGLDPDTGAPIPGGKLDPKAAAKKAKKGEWRAPSAQTTFKDQVAKAVQQLKPYKSKPRSKTAALFLQGAPASSRVDDKKLAQLQKQNPGASITDLRRQATQKAPALPAIPKTVLTTALDVVYNGKISRATVRELHGAGIRVTKLPYQRGPTPRRSRGPRQTPARRAARSIPGLGTRL